MKYLPDWAKGRENMPQISDTRKTDGWTDRQTDPYWVPARRIQFLGNQVSKQIPVTKSLNGTVQRNSLSLNGTVQHNSLSLFGGSWTAENVYMFISKRSNSYRFYFKMQFFKNCLVQFFAHYSISVNNFSSQSILQKFIIFFSNYPSNIHLFSKR